MFESADLSYGPRTKRLWTTIAGMTGQALLVGCALLAPLLWPQVIPRVAWAAVNLVPPVPPPPPKGTDQAPQRVVPVAHANRPFVQPTGVPNTPPAMIVDPPEAAPTRAGVPGGVPNGSEDGVPGSILDTILTAGARPPIKPQEIQAPVRTTVAKEPKTPPLPPRISIVEMARPIYRVEPIYPKLAITTRTQGVVRLMGVLGTDGRIRELKVLSGHPLLVNAAIDAVKQWVYAPTMLNGQPVEVQAPIDVNFILR